MRTVVVGALGAAIVYAGVWFGDTEQASVVASSAIDSRELEPNSLPQRRPGPAQGSKVQGQRRVVPRPTSRIVGQAFVPTGSRTKSFKTRSVSEGVLSTPDDKSPQRLKLPSEVKAALAETAGIKGIASSPQEFERRLQRLETPSPARLRELKAFAERFIELPDNGAPIDSH